MIKLKEFEDLEKAVRAKEAGQEDYTLNSEPMNALLEYYNSTVRAYVIKTNLEKTEFSIDNYVVKPVFKNLKMTGDFYWERFPFIRFTETYILSHPEIFELMKKSEYKIAG